MDVAISITFSLSVSSKYSTHKLNCNNMFFSEKPPKTQSVERWKLEHAIVAVYITSSLVTTLQFLSMWYIQMTGGFFVFGVCTN